MKKLAIFDAHVHVEFPFVQSRSDYLAISRQLGITAALTDSNQPGLSDGELRDLSIGRSAVVGREQFDIGEISNGLESGKYKAIKINLGFSYRYADDVYFAPVYAAALTFGAPIFFHTGDPGWSGAKIKYAHPITLDDIAVDYPGINFVLVHAGNPWFRDAALVASKNDNVLLEASALLEKDSLALDDRRTQTLVVDPIKYILDYLGSDRKLIFGSGWPMVDLPSYVAAYMAGVPASSWENVFYFNARRLFAKWI